MAHVGHRLGCGWRADCLGDMGGFSKSWNHMENCYRQQLEKNKAENLWKAAPVAFESCWDMRKWHDEGWDIPFIFDYALRLHATYVNNKSAPIPEGTRNEVERFLKRLGYRLVLKRLSHDDAVHAGTALRVDMEWENAGSAPPYRNYIPALRLTSTAAGGSLEHAGRASTKSWLPGIHKIVETVHLPRDFPPGDYRLSVAVVDPKTGRPAVRLAIEGRDPDGWYPLSRLTVTAP